MIYSESIKAYAGLDVKNVAVKRDVVNWTPCIVQEVVLESVIRSLYMFTLRNIRLGKLDV